MSAMETADRIRTKQQIIAALETRDFDDIHLILDEFGLRTPSGEWDHWTTKEIIAFALRDANDEDLRSVLEFVHPSAVSIPASQGHWTGPGLKLFLSHISKHKAFVSEVSATLGRYGVEAFVAHEDIAPTKEWMEVIDNALRTCDALCAFLQDGFIESNWCDQEAGVVYARRKLLIPIRLDGNDPHGFLSKYQGLKGVPGSAGTTAARIVEVLVESDATRDLMVDSLIEAAVAATSYEHAADVSRLLRDLNVDWTEARQARLAESLNNSQVVNSYVARPIVNSLVEDFRRRLEEDEERRRRELDEVPF